MQTLVLAVVFVGVVSLMVGTYLFINRRKLAIADAALARLAPESVPAIAALLKEEERASELGLLNRVLSGRAWTERLRWALKRGGSSLRPGAFVLLTGVTTVAGGLLGSRLGVAGLIAGVAAGIAGPIVWLQRRRQRRLGAFEAQLPDAIDMLASALKSGYSFHAATNFLGQELAPPLGAEFGRMYDEQRLGIDARTALMSFEDRVGSLDVKMLVTALLIQRETGGNLSEVLTNASDTMRERAAVRGRLDSLTAEARYSARVLAALPVAVFLGFYLFIPEFTDSFRESVVGQTMLVGAAVSVVLGYVMLMKIADVDF
ncbi:MAG: type II secretion system F family protein [Gemmatimonadota bacterium]|nr:type II secretion system F family protein [Gemmatimonadota bacterium]